MFAVHLETLVIFLVPQELIILQQRLLKNYQPDILV